MANLIPYRLREPTGEEPVRFFGFIGLARYRGRTYIFLYSISQPMEYRQSPARLSGW